jgi:HNH endonuclease
MRRHPTRDSPHGRAQACGAFRQRDPHAKSAALSSSPSLPWKARKGKGRMKARLGPEPGPEPSAFHRPSAGLWTPPAAHDCKPGECWPWQGNRGVRGVGRYRWRDGRRQSCVMAHRLMWILECGPVPVSSEVAHRCLDLACVNPDHLIVTTAGGRCALLPKRGRSIAGMRHPMRKLTPATIRRLIALKRRRPDLTGIELARRLGLRSAAWVNRVLRGAGWVVVAAERIGPQPKGPRPRRPS